MQKEKSTVIAFHYNFYPTSLHCVIGNIVRSLRVGYDVAL